MSLTVTELVPAPSFAEHHERLIGAPRAAIEQAMETVTVGQVRLLAPLIAVRARLAWPTGPTPPGPPGLRGDRPLVDALGPGFEWFVREPGLQVFVMVGQPHRLRGGQGRRVGSPEGFAAFAEPGFCRIATEVRLIERPAGLLVSTDTLIGCTDAATRRRFAAYWLLIRPFSGAIRRGWLAAIDRRAQALSTAHE
jgi:hypothetical protein